LFRCSVAPAGSGQPCALYPPFSGRTILTRSYDSLGDHTTVCEQQRKTCLPPSLAVYYRASGTSPSCHTQQSHRVQPVRVLCSKPATRSHPLALLSACNRAQPPHPDSVVSSNSPEPNDLTRLVTISVLSPYCMQSDSSKLSLSCSKLLP